MTEIAGSLSFGFEADFTGFTRAAERVGPRFDRLARSAAQWGEATSSNLSRTLDGARGLQTAQSGALEASARAMPGKAKALNGAIVAPNGLTTAQVLAGCENQGNREIVSLRVV